MSTNFGQLKRKEHSAVTNLLKGECLQLGVPNASGFSKMGVALVAINTFLVSFQWTKEKCLRGGSESREDEAWWIN